MESLEIKLLTFITPHLFYFTTDLDSERRTTFLNKVSSRIKNCLLGSRAVSHEEKLSNDEIFAVPYKSDYARASVLEKICFKEGQEEIYFCWLIDYATLIKTDKIFRLPADIQKITARSRQASLSNICYLREHLELGLKGVVKKMPSLVPHSGVVQYCLELLVDYDKLTFEVSERSNDVLIGELLIHKGKNVLYLSKELCAKELVTVNELMFQNLFCCTREYMKTHLKTIYQVCQGRQETDSQHDSSGNSSCLSPSNLDNEMEELDINTPPLENGRRRKTLLKKSQQGSPNLEDKELKSPLNVHKEEANLSRGARLLQKLKARKSAEGLKQASASSSSSSSNKSKEDTSSAAYDSSTTETKSDNLNAKESSSPEAESDMETTPIKEETSVSPFASITSQKRNKSGCIFMPAGMRFTKTKEVTPPKKKVIAKSPSPNLKTTADEDCPSIKVPKVPESATDTQLSVEDSESKPESTSSEPKSEIFTKQDFCKFMGGGCTCVQCRLTLEDDDWDAPINFEAANNEIQEKPQSTDLIIKPPKLLKEHQQAQQNEILSINYSGMLVLEKKLSCKVLVHGESIPAPIRSVAQVNLHRDIYNTMRRINYKESKRIQHYAFPAITRNQHVFMVNDSKSGKTMAYLPILMSFLMEKGERYSQLFKLGGGPLMVILASNSKKCEEIYDLTKIILNKYNRKLSLVTYPGYGNISNIDVLITMPTILTNLLASRATNFKRLCHLVFEDADVILKLHNDSVKKFFNYADQVLEHRNCPKSIQLIMCAQHWTVEMEDVLMKLNKVPMVCIGNHLEAALYGKMKFTMKFLDTGCKEQNLKKILHDKYKYTKSVIVCNNEELEDVQTFLTLKGIEFTSFLGVTQEEDILYLEAVWNNMQPGKYAVLLCTDDIYNTINITSAQLLIHFSLPRSWSQFIKRFSCLLENIPSPLDNNQKKMEISSFVFIDENCEQRMSKFSNFIKIAGLEKELPVNIKLFFEELKQQQEYKRIEKKTDICETLKLFGTCPSLYCNKRHLLNKALDASDILPKNGSIKFKILRMLDAASCSIKLLEHVDLARKNVFKFEDLTENIAQTLLAKTDEYCPVSKPVVTHLYLFKENTQYFRCKLVEMDDDLALVFLIDRGIYCQGKADGLFKMPEELKTIPPQCYEVRFANLIPPFKDNRFCRASGQNAQFLLDSNCPDSIMTATILLQINNNLWLDDVYEYREMHDKSLPTVGYQLTRELITQGLAVRDAKPLEELYDLCKKMDIELPEYKVHKATSKKKPAVAQIEPSWAFLDGDAIHEVTFTFAMSPQEFYIRQNKFSKQLLELEEAIKHEIRKPFYPTPKHLKVGKCCLVKDQVTGHYVRGMILNIEDDEKVEIMCVDYGDVVIDDLPNIKHVTNDLISKLPFQSIQCSMYGVKPVDDDWTDAATDLLYTMAFEEDACTFRPLFAKVNAKQANLLVKRQNSYSLTLKDGLTRRVLLNELLVDCGFAIPSGEMMENFDLPPSKVESDDDDFVEEIERSEDDPVVQDQTMNFDDFDLEINSLADFMIALDLPVTKLSDTKATNKKPPMNSLPALKATPAVNYLTPEVRWSQTDTHLKLNIQVSDVITVKLTIKHNRNFQFSTMKDGKEYRLNLVLFAKVDNTAQHTIFGPQIRVTLKKCKPADWPRLLYTQDKVRKIYYDVSTIYLKGEEEEQKRKPLQLDISDSSSEGEDDDYTPYFLCSDLDSDYDYDIPNDDD